MIRLMNCVLPWYNRNSWLDVKTQSTLPTFQALVTRVEQVCFLRNERFWFAKSLAFKANSEKDWLIDCFKSS